MTTVAIIDYGSGNLRSAARAFERMALPGQTIHITSSLADIAAASHIVLPGVGAFADCMTGLKAVNGMMEELETQVLSRKKPFLGICVGMQMLFEKGMEYGEHTGLGWLKGQVVRIENTDTTPPLKIPHMGWNDVTVKKPHPLLEGIASGDHFYFVHSYHAVCPHPEEVLATVEYGRALTAMVAHDNIMGTQFHPEKSQEKGLRVIRNFLASDVF